MQYALTPGYTRLIIELINSGPTQRSNADNFQLKAWNFYYLQLHKYLFSHYFCNSSGSSRICDSTLRKLNKIHLTFFEWTSKRFYQYQTSSLDTDSKEFKESMSTLNSFIKSLEVDLVTKIFKAHQTINDHDKAIKNKIETAYNDFQRLMICHFQKPKQFKIIISIFRIYYAKENKLSKFYSLAKLNIKLFVKRHNDEKSSIFIFNWDTIKYESKIKLEKSYPSYAPGA